MKTSQDARAAGLEAMETANSPELYGAENFDLRLALDRFYLAASKLSDALYEAGR